jgi:hypothetical protein
MFKISCDDRKDRRCSSWHEIDETLHMAHAAFPERLFEWRSLKPANSSYSSGELLNELNALACMPGYPAGLAVYYRRQLAPN